MLTDFQNYCTVGKRMKFATKLIRHYPPHLRHVATLPWEIKNANFLQIFSTYGRNCKQIALLLPEPSLFIHKFRYFQCLEERVFAHTDCKYNFLCHCCFTCLVLQLICGTRNSSQQMSQQCLSMSNIVFSDENKILIKTQKFTQNTQLQA